MRRITWLTGCLLVLTGSWTARGAEENLLPEMPTVKASFHEAPPPWALMERRLIGVMQDEAAPFFLNKFTRPDGQTYGGGPYDDVYEMFYNWCLLYAIGGDEKLYRWALKEYNAITDQCTVYDAKRRDYHHQLYKEFPEHDDWFHIGEGLMSFYDFGEADPALPQMIDRAKRFAGFYMNEDEEAASNYDPTYKVIRSVMTGSRGASDQGGGGWILEHNAASLQPVMRLDEGWQNDPETRRRAYQLYDEIVRRCDVPVNLNTTALVTNAYLYTGDKKYKKWVLEYTDAWMDRIQRNDGILPDNIGRTGKIGEYRDGQWWGGLWGWAGSCYGADFNFLALTVASECAYLLSGDPKYLNLIRSQIDMLLERSKITDDGQLVVPTNFNEKGWSNYRAMRVRELAHLWHASMDPADWKRIERLKAGSKLDWNTEPVTRDRCAGASEYPRLMYYAGENPNWPLESLTADYRFVIDQMEYLINDKKDIHSIQADWLLYSNPLATKSLQQVTMGAPQTMYHGGLLRARVRYYVAKRTRPGLPRDVAALVERLAADRTVIKLVNTSTRHPRKLIVQAGAFGEHRFTDVKYTEQVVVEWGKQITEPARREVKDRLVAVNGKYFAVEMPPGTAITLDIGTRRFVNQPSYAFPWHGGRVPRN